MPKANHLRIKAYEYLRTAIIRGEFEAGAALSENLVAEKLGISRTPVREAIHALARDGFVEIVPTRGCFVRRFSVTDLYELFMLRECLEGFAARCAAVRATDADVQALQQLLDQAQDTEGWEGVALLGTELHQKIVALAGSQRLAALLDSLQGQIFLTRVSAMRGIAGRRDEVHQEHRAIVEAIKDRDPDLAEQLARTHVRNSYQAALRALEEGFRP